MLTVNQSAFSFNLALGGDNNTAPSQTSLATGPNNGFGAGIVVFQGSATISASAVNYNRAVGGAGAVNQNGGLGVGGGIFFFNFLAGGVTGSVDHAAIMGNAAIGGPGGSGGNGGDGLAAGNLGGTDLLGTPPAAETVTVSNTLVALDLAQGGRGSDGGDGLGGGLYNDAGSTLTATDSVVILNAARGGLGQGPGHAGQGIGGGIYNLRPGTFVNDSSIIALNIASTSNPNVFDA